MVNAIQGIDLFLPTPNALVGGASGYNEHGKPCQKHDNPIPSYHSSLLVID